MKKAVSFLSLIFLTVFLVTFGSCKSEDNKSQLTIWAYDSFNSEWGPGAEVSATFKELTGITINWVCPGDAKEVLARLLFEKDKANADIILGIDQNMAISMYESGLLEAYTPLGAENIFDDLVFDPLFFLTPMDYSYFAIVYDSEKLPNPPQCLEDLTLPQYYKSLILIDPRTSSPGLGFFCWVKEHYGDAWLDYWQRLQPSILTIANGWSTAYGLFTQGEAPMVLSYTSSPGYHLEYEETERYKAAIFSDGHPMQIEVAGLLQAAKNKENAKLFLDFMVSEDFQDLIPLTNWMYPVIDLPLPASFRVNPKSDKPLFPEAATEEELNEWAALMILLGS